MAPDSWVAIYGSRFLGGYLWLLIPGWLFMAPASWVAIYGSCFLGGCFVVYLFIFISVLCVLSTEWSGGILCG